MWPDYKKLVLQDYHQKRLANALSPGLIDPTPGLLKQECILVLNERYHRRDDKTLKHFFKLNGEAKLTEEDIERFDTEKFKPLSNYLKNPSKDTGRKNIELLAWLIDFELRPYEFGRKYNSVDHAATEVNKGQRQSNSDTRTAAPSSEPNKGEEINDRIVHVPIFSGKPYFNFKSIVVFALVLIFLIVSAMVYWLGEKNNPKINLTGLERCMYWAGDQYQQVSCNQKLGDTMIIAFDSARFYGLRKINTPDTITLRAIGNVWYIKRNNQLEFYTSGGYYPDDPEFRLRPVTEFIIRKHILAGRDGKLK